jgi:penicillin-binding protein activator
VYLKTHKMRFSIQVFFLIFFFACSQRTVNRVEPEEEINLSGRWNDTDSRLVANRMTADFLASEKYKEYAMALGKKPAIILGTIKNKTTEHIDASNYLKKFELAIYNSGVAELVESDEHRDKLRIERVQQQEFSDPSTISQWGKEVGANLMLFGEMTSETDIYNNKRVVNYQTTLFLTDMETNKRIWYGQHEIKKFIKN